MTLKSFVWLKTHAEVLLCRTEIRSLTRTHLRIRIVETQRGESRSFVIWIQMPDVNIRCKECQTLTGNVILLKNMLQFNTHVGHCCCNSGTRSENIINEVNNIENYVFNKAHCVTVITSNIFYSRSMWFPFQGQ